MYRYLNSVSFLFSDVVQPRCFAAAENKPTVKTVQKNGEVLGLLFLQYHV